MEAQENRKIARGGLEMEAVAAEVVDIYPGCASLEVAVEVEAELILMDHKHRGVVEEAVVDRIQLEILLEDPARMVQEEEDKQHREVPEAPALASSSSPGNGGT